jgi:hypothetical protein
MKEDMMKMMKGESHDSADHDSAKLEVLEELRELAMSMMGDKVKSRMNPMDEMKEVTVAAPDEEGLEQGLELAKEVIPGQESEEDDMELDEIEEMIRDLEEKKRAKMMKV